MESVKWMLLRVLLVMTFFTLSTHASEQKAFFSLKALQLAVNKPLAPVEFVKASDGIALAFRAYVPPEPKAIVVFYHGAGAHSGLAYNHIGADLRDKFSIGVYTPDVRGHGFSQGERGDAPSKEQVWSDINTIINKVKSRYPTVPIFLGGHSAGAGLVLNYSSWEQKSELDGYVFLAPYWGFRSETSHDDNHGYQFTTVKVSRFVLNSMSGGWLFTHAKAVHFHFPEWVLQQNPRIITFNTVTMSHAVTPHAPGKQLENLHRVGLWIGRQDEAFDAQKVVDFTQRHYHSNVRDKTVILDDVTHFSILVEGAGEVGPWILQTIK